MKHTNGKWSASYNGRDMYISSYDDLENPTTQIAIGKLTKGGKPQKEHEANAKLISKAPEMYEALKDLTIAAYDGRGLFKVQNRVRSLLKEIES